MTPLRRPIRVLLVEDNPGDALLIRSALDESRWSFEVLQAGRLADAVDLAATDHPDVVLLDLGLPDSTGEETFQSFRDAQPRLPVVVLTGLDDDDAADDALLAGAQDYLLKGGSVNDTVARAVRNAIERSRLAAQVDRHHRQRGALVELGRVALSGVDHTALSAAAAEQVAQALGISIAAVIDHDHAGEQLLLAGACGLDGTDEAPSVIPVDRSTLPGLTVTTGRSVIVHDAATSRERVDLGLCTSKARSAICVPVCDGDQVLGVIGALGPEPGRFEPGDVEFLEAVGNLMTEATHRRNAVREAQDREAFVTSLLRQIPGMTWTFDRELRLRSARGTRLTQLGVVEADLVGRSLADILNITEVERATAAHESALSGTPSSYQYTTPDGSTWQAHVEPLRGADGAIEGVVGSSIDVTEAVRTRRELREHQQQLSTIFEQLPIGLWTTDTELRFTSVLGDIVDLIGQTPDEILGRELRDYFGGDPITEDSLRAHRAALAGEGASALLAWMGVSFQVRIEPLRDAEGAIVGTAGVALDVTDLHRAQREVEEREQRFGALVEHAPDIIMILDADARVRYSSPSLRRVSGWSPEELSDTDVWDLLHPDDVAPGHVFWEKVLATHESLGPISYRTRDRAGRYRYTEAVYTNRLEDPAVQGVIVNLRDVTAQRRVERSLRDSEARFRRLADNAPDIIFRMSLGADARVEYVSPAVEQVTGFTVQECYDDPDLALRLLVPEDHDLVTMARAGRPPDGPVQLRLRRKDGAFTWAEVRFVTVSDGHGQIVGVEGIARDVSQSKLAEETLRGALTREQQAARDLRQLHAMKNGFLQAVSHELRTPLTAVVGFSALLEDRDRLDDARYHQLVTRLGANAKRLQRLLTDLLDVDRMTRATLEPQRTDTDVRDLVSRVAEDLIEEGLLVRIHGEPTQVAIDAAKTERIVENLLRNAGKHAPGELVEVTIDRNPEGVVLAVEDRGPGVPDTLKQAVFEPFRQGDTDASKVGGLGIGLSVVQTFAQLHGGRAWVEDRPGGGASFRVLLPEAGSSVGQELGHLGLDEIESGAGTDQDLEVDDAARSVEPDHVHTVDL